MIGSIELPIWLEVGVYFVLIWTILGGLAHLLMKRRRSIESTRWLEVLSFVAVLVVTLLLCTDMIVMISYWQKQGIAGIALRWSGLVLLGPMVVLQHHVLSRWGDVVRRLVWISFMELYMLSMSNILYYDTFTNIMSQFNSMEITDRILNVEMMASAVDGVVLLLLSVYSLGLLGTVFNKPSNTQSM